MDNDISEAQVEDSVPQVGDGAESPTTDFGGIPFPVVGIGASAGGVEALRAFFRALPVDTGMSFVVIQHLDPHHASRMDEILVRETSLPVVQIEDDTPLRPDHVHLLPPDATLRLAGVMLQLQRPRQHSVGPPMPVDILLRSLAEAAGSHAAAVILSGSGSDGSEGVKAIKAAGGLVLVQDPQTAGHPEMPRNAIATGVADAVVVVEELPAVLLRARSWQRPDEAELAISWRERLGEVRRLLVDRAGVDFAYYKESTLIRRVQRRADLLQLAPGEYLPRLRADEEEAGRLSRDLLISVTSFFRDPAAWNKLRRQVVPQLFQHGCDGRPVRAWVPGCATGEEAYSLAMLLCEEARRGQHGCGVQVYASDIDDAARQRARRGVYSANVAQDLDHDLVERYLIEEDGRYRVSKQLRDTVVFARQHLLVDPPFSNLDLITCRNLLIYLEPEMQQRAIELFHFSLNEGGFLFLGNAESLGRGEHLFEPVSQRHRIYHRRGEGRKPAASPTWPIGDRSIVSQGEEPEGPPRPDTTRILHRALLEYGGPTALLVDPADHVLAVHGETGPFLRYPAGRPTDDLHAILIDDLCIKVRTVLATARREAKMASATWLRPARADAPSAVVELAARPLSEGETPDEDTGSTVLLTLRQRRPIETDAASDGDGGRDVHALEIELSAAYRDLRETSGELQAARERHRIQKQEVLSMNEELQSANEELETSKEELQSLNEELKTINQQLSAKVEELENAHDDLANLLRSTNVITVFLDKEMCIRRFTPPAGELLNLRLSDLGRPMTQISSDLHVCDMLDEAGRVLDDLERRSAEITADGRCFLRVIQPYRTDDDRIEGVVLTFTDITELTAAQRELESARAEAEQQRQRLYSLFMQAPMLIGVFAGRDQVCQLANLPLARLLGSGSVLDLPLADIPVLAAWDDVASHLAQALSEGKAIVDSRVVGPPSAASGGSQERCFDIIYQPWRDAAGEVAGVMMLAHDVSAQIEDQSKLEELSAALRKNLVITETILESIGEGLITHDPQGDELRLNAAARRLLRRGELPTSLDALVERWACRNVDGQPLDPEEDPLALARRGAACSERRIQVHDLATDRVWDAEVAVNRAAGTGAAPALVVFTVRDISERLVHEALLNTRTADLVRSNDSLQAFATLASHDMRAPLRLLSTYLDLIEHHGEEDYAENCRANIGRARAAAERLRELLEGLLQYARVSGSDGLPSAAVSLEEVADIALSHLSDWLRSRYARVEVGPLPQIRGQPVLLAQCLENLITNAVKYNDSPEPTVQITATKASDSCWRIDIIDNGCGIPVVERERIFEMLRRGERPSDQGGSGIGLAFCRRIIDAFGGRIWIADDGGIDGTGTTLSFILPSADAP